MLYPEVLHHGAVDDVSGSCHQLCMDADHSVLIDCGLFQNAGSVGGQSAENRLAIEFSLETIKALVVTHVHADHIGRLPHLLAAGYTGPILCSEPSARLLPLVLEDAFKLEFGRDPRKIERYLALISQRTIALPFDTWFTLVDTHSLICRIRLHRAGHILGSAYIECEMVYPLENRDRRVVFSGDLGASPTPMLPSPKAPERADLLVLESTYGDRLHEDRSARQARLERVIDKALADHGTVLIPAFSMGRTQELLYEIEDILHRKALLERPHGVSDRALSSLPINWPQLPVILDSPLASRFTEVYEAFDDSWDAEAQVRLSAGRTPLSFKQLITIDSHAQHMQTVNYLASTGRPAIVIAGSGMCSSGRIVNYLKAMLGDSRHNVIFVGYQARHTPGWTIQTQGSKAGDVELDGERYPIRAGVTTLGGYSAHADQQGLVDFVTGMRQWPAEIRLVHGENAAKQVLSQALQRQYAQAGRGVKVVIPGH